MDTRVFYIRDASKFPVACVATTVIDETPGSSDLEIAYAVAIFNPKDSFDKVRGRQIAVGRLEKPRGYNPEHPFGGVQGYVRKERGAAKEILLQIAKNQRVPQRVREAAKYHASQWREEEVHG